jgi:hypothetical protein
MVNLFDPDHGPPRPCQALAALARRLEKCTTTNGISRSSETARVPGTEGRFKFIISPNRRRESGVNPGGVSRDRTTGTV